LHHCFCSRWIDPAKALRDIKEPAELLVKTAGVDSKLELLLEAVSDTSTSAKKTANTKDPKAKAFKNLWFSK